MDVARGTARTAWREATLPWIPALDGLRAVAVLSVILFHTKTKSVFVGGFIGVDLFFVLSGFLITAILAREWQTSGRVSLPAFYLRRARRLLPAAAFFLAVFLVDLLLVSMLIRPAPLRLAGFSIGWIAGYAFNWRMAFELPIPSGFGHLWSLSVEEQYYLLWPAVLLAMLGARLPLRAMVAITLAAGAVSAVVPFIAAGSSWARLYYGTDFRAHELLIGSAIGLLYASGTIGPLQMQSRVGRTLVWIAAAFLVVRLVLGGNDKSAWMFTGGFAVVALAAATVILHVVCARDGVAARLLGSRPLTYVGRRSYALYLWHLPVAQAFAAASMVLQPLLTFAVALGFAEVSYRFAEGWGGSHRQALRRAPERTARLCEGGEADALAA